jgi:alkylation response protein AidB-like acyl-CoA dehydrogenase
MDFGVIDLDDNASAFWQEVRDFLDCQLTAELRDHVRRSGTDYFAPFHRAMGARGWLFPGWPRSEGGAGLDGVRQHILALELSRRAAPVTVADTTFIGAHAVKTWGGDLLRSEILARAAAGDARICLGYTEPDAGSDLAAVRTRAVPRSGHWVVTGSKMFSTGAHECEFSFLLARTNTRVSKHRGLTMFLVPLEQAAVTIQPIATIGGERTNLVFYDDAVVDDRYRLGPVDDGWTVLSTPLDDEHGIGPADPDRLDEISGQGAWHNRSLQRVFAAALRWARTARPGGAARPIDDPAVAARLAEVAMDIEVVRNTPGAMGRVVAAEVFIRDSAALLELAGPEGLLLRGQDGAVQDGTAEWGHRFAQGSAIYGGTVEIQRNIIARKVLGLPRPPA